MRPGAILLEVLLAAAIGSVVSVVLAQVWAQMAKVQQAVDTRFDMEQRVALINHQFEHDLSGVFIPVFDEKKTTTLAEQFEEKKPVPTKLFYAANNENNLSQLTFITSNALRVYWSDQAGSAKPRIARVAYFLEPDADHKGSFTLYRQEGQELALDSFTGPNAPKKYPLIEGVKSLSCQYVVMHDAQKDAEGKKVSEREYETHNDWLEMKEQTADGKVMIDAQTATGKNKMRPPLPNAVKINLELWDNVRKRSRGFSIVVPTIIASQKQDPKKAEEQKDLKNKDKKEAEKLKANNSGNQKAQNAPIFGRRGGR